MKTDAGAGIATAEVVTIQGAHVRLLLGGDKSTQVADVARAQESWKASIGEGVDLQLALGKVVR